MYWHVTIYELADVADNLVQDGKFLPLTEKVTLPALDVVAEISLAWRKYIVPGVKEILAVEMPLAIDTVVDDDETAR